MPSAEWLTATQITHTYWLQSKTLHTCYLTWQYNNDRRMVLCCIGCSGRQKNITERNVNNDIPHWDGLEHVKNWLFRSRRSRDGTLNSRRVLIPQNVDIIVHILWDKLIFVRHYIRYNTNLFHNFNSLEKNVHTAIGEDKTLKIWKITFSFHFRWLQKYVILMQTLKKCCSLFSVHNASFGSFKAKIAIYVWIPYRIVNLVKRPKYRSHKEL